MFIVDNILTTTANNNIALAIIISDPTKDVIVLALAASSLGSPVKTVPLILFIVFITNLKVRPNCKKSIDIAANASVNLL